MGPVPLEAGLAEGVPAGSNGIEFKGVGEYDVSNILRNILLMPTRKIGETNIRKITKVGRASLAVTLPIDMVRKLKWRERQKIVVSKKGSQLIIKDWKSGK
ncbi:MAG: hypothetical protein WC609_02670 [Candidatus Paceibacterota bacterium]|jgi:hypothetical protein